MSTADAAQRNPRFDRRTAPFADRADALCALTARYAERGWVPATSSNFSFRLDAAHCAVTSSGGDKGRLQPGELLIVDLQGRIVSGQHGSRRSAETALHLARYRRGLDVGAVLHTHAPRAVLATRLLAGPETPWVELEGYELLKALPGIGTHRSTVRIPVVANDQDVDALAACAERALEETEAAAHPVKAAPAYLIEGHGIYAWGATLDDAARHLEAIDYLLGIELELARHRPRSHA